MARPPPRPTIPTGDEFHVPGARVYAAPLGPAIHKRAEAMARVVYNAVHENRAFDEGTTGEATAATTPRGSSPRSPVWRRGSSGAASS